MNSRRAALILILALVHGASGFTAPAADVAFFGIIKSQEFVQTNASAPVARATDGFAFNSFVLATTNNVVTNATVKPSNSTPLRTLVSTNADQLFWRFEERFNTQSSLDNTYPYGSLFSPVNYTFTIGTTNDGIRTVNLNYSLLSLVGGQPAVPQITNFAAAQAIDHTADFQLRFVASGSALLDLVQIIVMDGASNIVFASPAPFSTGALTGASNACTIPGYSLPPGSQLIGHLAFVRPTFLETNAYTGALGVPAVLRDTEFPLVTRPAPAPPRLEVLSPGATPFVVGFTGEPNRYYRLQGTLNLTNWFDLGVTNSATGTGTFTDPTSGTVSNRFYRLKVGT
jgi:hypothetical protein